MITFVLFALSYVTGTPVPGTVYWLTSLIDGVVILPLLTLSVVPFVARILREKIGRLHYLQSVAPLECVVLVLTPWGYEFAPVIGDTVHLKRGLTFELGDGETWYRLGKTKFGVTYAPTEEVLDDVLVDESEVTLASVPIMDDDGNVTDYAPAGRDGKAVLTKQRGAGFHGYTPVPDLDYRGFLVSLSRAINSLRGGGGVRLSERTEKMTRVEHGGGKGMSNWARVTAYTATIFMACVVGVLIFGVL